MANDLSIPPPLISIPRIQTLIASLLVSLGSGTNYVYSAYSPQLGTRLKISHTQLNIVAMAGNVGAYTTGPIWGRIVDTRGPRILLVCGFVFLLGGYSGIRYFYDSGLAPGELSIPIISFCALVLCSFLTGAGSNGGFISSVNSTAKTFPDQLRASTTGLVISGFGLSAFLFSSVFHMFFAGSESSFLLFLSLGSSFPMILGFLFIHPIPLPEEENPMVNRGGHPETSFSAYEQHNESYTSLLDLGYIEANGQDEDDTSYYTRIGSDVELSSTRSEHNHGQSLSRHATMALGMSPNVHGRQLVRSGNFWLLFTMFSTLSGTGLMYINNVGSMSLCLYAHNNPDYDEVVASGWQAAQVSTISVMSFIGRIFIGLISDFMKNKYGMPRSYCIVLVAVLSFISQIVAGSVDTIAHLWIASALVGLSYGSFASLFPAVCLEWFGMPHFSENYGYISLSPLVAANLFSILFGRNLDAHDGSRAHKAANPPLTDLYSSPKCLQGLSCYVDAIYLTMLATFMCVLLSIWAGYRDWVKITTSRKIFSAGTELHGQEEEAGQ